MVYHSCHASLLRKSSGDLVRIPDDTLPSSAAVFCIIGAMGLQGMRRARPDFGESMAVMGLGLLGLFAVRCGSLGGLFPLIALDFNEKRRKIAVEFGADAAFSPGDPELVAKIRRLAEGDPDMLGVLFDWKRIPGNERRIS